MAGAVKHMERSRRSHRKDYGMFTNFHRNAHKKAEAKQQKLTIGQSLSRFFRKMMPKTTSK